MGDSLPIMSTHTLVFAIALLAAGVDATTYAKAAIYTDSSCSILKENRYYPSSASGTCTTSAEDDSPYSFKFLDTIGYAYSTSDCTSSTILTFSDTTSCQAAGSSYAKTIGFTESFSGSGAVSTYYTGTDATTSTCTSDAAYYVEFPLDTCFAQTSGSSVAYFKYTGCTSAGVAIYSRYSDSSCSTASSTGNTDSSWKSTCTVYNEDSNVPGSYESSQLDTCYDTTTAPTPTAPTTTAPTVSNSALGCFQFSLAAIAVALVAMLQL